MHIVPMHPLRATWLILMLCFAASGSAAAQPSDDGLAESIGIWKSCVLADSARVGEWRASLDSLERSACKRPFRQAALNLPILQPFMNCMTNQSRQKGPYPDDALDHPLRLRNSLGLISPEALRQLDRIPGFGPPPPPRRVAGTLCKYISPHAEVLTALMDTLPADRTAARRAVNDFFEAHVPRETPGPKGPANISACIFFCEEVLSKQPADRMNYRRQLVHALGQADCGLTQRFIATLLERSLVPH